MNKLCILIGQCLFFSIEFHQLKKSNFFFNFLNLELDSESEDNMSPNLALKNNDRLNKFTTEFMTP